MCGFEDSRNGCGLNQKYPLIDKKFEMKVGGEK
jgi:hypothetical protein